MGKRLIIVLALAFVVGLAFAAYAEVQNVKVSGDITMTGVYRNNLDLKKSTPSGGVTTITNSDQMQNAISQVRLRVDADLTDNVSTTVRLINERTWGYEDDTTSSTEIDLDLAYATLKEFLYSPLTLTVGRQELHFGNDMIIGDIDTNGTAAARSNIPLYERDMSLRKSFDAVRATLNYDPLVVDLIYSTTQDASSILNDDTTLTGINANYMLNKQTTLEGYFWSKTKGSNATKLSTQTIPVTKTDKVFVVGGRAHNTSIKNLTLSLESAFQFGDYNPGFDINAGGTAATAKRRAWALEAFATYDLKGIGKLAKYAPSITAAYAYFSGDNPKQRSTGDTWHGWDSMYENQTFGHLINAIMGYTNCHIIGLSGKMKVVQDVTLNMDYVYLLLAKHYNYADIINLKGVPGAYTYYMTDSKNVGQEIDAKLTYDYTEDVQFGLLTGVFLPGRAFYKDTVGDRTTAGEVIGSMKVTF